MTKTAKNCLSLMLILSLALLPLRMAFAMDMADAVDQSSNHCKSMVMADADQVVQSAEADQTIASTSSNCCEQNNGDCSNCISSVAAIETETPSNIRQSFHVEQSFTLTTVHTRTLTPPFRPPQLHI